MQEIGNFGGDEPLRSDEERTHWGLWCVISAPLVLGTDLSNVTIMDRIWPVHLPNPDPTLAMTLTLTLSRTLGTDFQ